MHGLFFKKDKRRNTGGADEDSQNTPAKPVRSFRELRNHRSSSAESSEKKRQQLKGRRNSPSIATTFSPAAPLPSATAGARPITNTISDNDERSSRKPAAVLHHHPTAAAEIRPTGWDIPGGSARNNKFRLSHGENGNEACILLQTYTSTRLTISSNQPFSFEDAAESSISALSHLESQTPLSKSQSAPVTTKKLYPTVPSERAIDVSKLFSDTYKTSSSSSSSAAASVRIAEGGARHNFYFEVTINESSSTALSIGLLFSLSNNNSNNGLLVTPPGERTHSIGFSSEGFLQANGEKVSVDGASSKDLRFGKSDTIGCGIEISTPRKVFYTKNGQIIVQPTRFVGFDNYSYCIPSLGVQAKQQGSVLQMISNFGQHTFQFPVPSCRSSPVPLVALGHKTQSSGYQSVQSDAGALRALNKERLAKSLSTPPATATSTTAAATSSSLYPTAAAARQISLSDEDRKLPPSSAGAVASAATPTPTSTAINTTSLYPSPSTAMRQISSSNEQLQQKLPASFPLGKRSKSALEDDVPTAAQSMHLGNISHPQEGNKKPPPPIPATVEAQGTRNSNSSSSNNSNSKNSNNNYYANNVAAPRQQQQNRPFFGTPSRNNATSLADAAAPQHREQEQQKQQYHFGTPSNKKKTSLEDDLPLQTFPSAPVGQLKKMKKSLLDDDDSGDEVADGCTQQRQQQQQAFSTFLGHSSGPSHSLVDDSPRAVSAAEIQLSQSRQHQQFNRIRKSAPAVDTNTTTLYGTRSDHANLEENDEDDVQMQNRLLSIAQNRNRKLHDPQSQSVDVAVNVAAAASTTIDDASRPVAPAPPAAATGTSTVDVTSVPDVGALRSQVSLTLDNLASPYSNPATAGEVGGRGEGKGNNDTEGCKSEDEILNAAIEESKRDLSIENIGILTSKEIESIKDNARTLRSLAAEDKVDVSVLETFLTYCRNDQQTVNAGFEKSMQQGSDDFTELITLNDIVLNAIEIGKKKVNEFRNRTPKASRSKASLEIGVLVSRKDVFSLLCVLRAQNEKRLDAALALMKFARDDDEDETNGSVGSHSMNGSRSNHRLRDEIRSSGGMHSLVTVFRTKGSSHELRVVAALAVAYVLPSFVESSSHNPPSLCLKIMECLRFLSTAREVSPKRERITREEMYKASAMGVTSFWINELAPVLSAEKDKTTSSSHELNAVTTALSPTITKKPQQKNNKLGRKRPRRQEHHRPGGVSFDQSIELQELLEMTVSLIVHIERLSDSDEVASSVNNNNRSSVDKAKKSNDSLFNWRYTLVEQVCAVDVARPIAVREGLLPLLVGWLKSKDKEKIHPAVSALRYLTSIKDKYMAGWIHSQMVNEGALVEVVKLADDYVVGQDVRLAVAQILSSLCVAPHTRAAVVEAKCINYLIGFLYDHSDQASEEVALFAGSAITQLAGGAISRASVFGSGDMELLDFVSPDKRDSLVDDIVNGGAVMSFIKIASNHVGRLRSMAIEAIRVLSLDTSQTRQTRLQLCEDGAARALGRALKNNISVLSTTLKPKFDSEVLLEDIEQESALGIPNSSLEDIHGALCALANMLDPVHDGGRSGHTNVESNSLDPRQVLIEGCIQTAESGGLSSLLSIASLPQVKITSIEESSELPVNQIELLEEACRCLQSLSPLLLSDESASKGYAKWACYLLGAFDRLLMLVDDDISELDSVRELTINTLLGLGALATYEPLKIRIVDQSLPALVQLKNTGGDQTDISNIASQVFLALGFEEDEIAVQVAGSNPSLLADWFCLQRSLIIQAMARSEIRRNLLDIWNEPFKKMNTDEFTKLIREVSKGPASDFEDLEEAYLFDTFADDDENSSLRRDMIRQYRDVYDAGKDSPNCDFLDLGKEVRGDGVTRSIDASLLAKHVYPLNTTEDEIKWVLSHQKAIDIKLSQSGRHRVHTSLSSSEHVEKLLDYCFPSRLIRSHILPVFIIRPDTSFNFRALMMPQRRYFSFRREGQLVSRFCDRQAEVLESDDVHWTLAFTNSTFAGEFSESLVQALYLCPMVRSLSFSRNPEWIAELENTEQAEDGGAFLANLACSLPPWINALTLENVFNDRGLETLVALFETMGRISAEQDLKGYSALERKMSSGSQAQWKFWSLSIRRSPQITGKAWQAFFKLLGKVDLKPNLKVSPPLSALKVLDISYNGLGDEKCGLILSLVYDRHSGCSLEQLDLSGNQIGEGAKVINVLRGYVEYHPYHTAARQMVNKRWQSPLHTLILAENDLNRGHAALEIAALLKHNALGLKVLDLSKNNLNVYTDEFSQVLVSSLLKNSLLFHLNLSGNCFRPHVIDDILERLICSETESGLAFFGLDNNTPPLTGAQQIKLENFVVESRQVALQRFFKEKKESDNSSDMDDMPGNNSMSLGFSNQLPVLDEKASLSGDLVDELGTSLPRESVRWTSRSSSIELDSVPTGDNMITVLFSAPLVFSDDQRVLRPFAKLDFEMERELMWQCLKEASRDIELCFDTATHDRLLAAMTKRCSCLHYSGHGHQSYLPFEDGSGGPNWFKVQDIQNLIARDGCAPFQFVFVSACYSGLAGETFASAGVPHVVCCQQESELKDSAALAFTRQFYLALAVGHTVKESFDQGCKSVRATPNLRDAEKEMKKFILLPKDGNHDVPVLRAKSVQEWPKVSRLSMRSSKLRRGKSFARASGRTNTGGAKTSELSVRNMMQEDPSPTPPQFFMGREVDMYHVLKAVLGKRLVSVIGEPGMGRSSLVCALCHYINERASTIIAIDEIYFVKAKLGRRGYRCRDVIEQLLEKLVEAGKGTQAEPGMDIENLFEIICKSLKHQKALIVFDCVELLERSDEEQEFPMLLSSLFQGTKNVKVLLTGRRTLGIPSLGGQVECSIQLGPLNFTNTVRLFANLCPHLHTPTDRRKFYEQLAKHGDQIDLLPSDECISERTKQIFCILGDGIPSKIEKSAYGISGDTLRDLFQIE